MSQARALATEAIASREIGSMTGGLSLGIRLLGQSDGRYELALSFRNETASRVLIPLPESTGFRFRRVGEAADAEWRTWTFQTARWKAVLLEPSQGRELAY